MSSGLNHNINGANHVKWSESQYRWSESHQVLCSLVKPLSIGIVIQNPESVAQNMAEL